jgi:hypothetical protein
MGYGLNSSGLEQRAVADPCEYGNEHSGPIKCSEFFEGLSSCWLLKNDSVSWS